MAKWPKWRNGPVSLLLVCGVLMVGATVTAQEPVPVRAYRAEPLDAGTLRTRFDERQVGLLEKLNRRDVIHLERLTEIVVPDFPPFEWPQDELAYSPLPIEWLSAAAQPKVIVVHQPAQVFGAYESGRLVRWGPVSSGRQETPTPAGQYNLTWKSKSRVSTDNEQWLLKWYFNFINSRGISFHEFDLPGQAASHACVRLLPRDAMWLYGWGEQWRLSPDGRTILTPGSVVVIHGVVDFSNPSPWTSVDWWKGTLTLPALVK